MPLARADAYGFHSIDSGGALRTRRICGKDSTVPSVQNLLTGRHPLIISAGTQLVMRRRVYRWQKMPHLARKRHTHTAQDIGEPRKAARQDSRRNGTTVGRNERPGCRPPPSLGRDPETRADGAAIDRPYRSSFTIVRSIFASGTNHSNFSAQAGVCVDDAKT